MTPTQVWKANKWRIDLRKYTREFSKKFESTKKLQVSPGNVYTAKYGMDSAFLTDKHHFTPLIISFGRFRDDEGKSYIRGINLFYLKTSQKLEILDEIHNYNKLSIVKRVSPIIRIHEKWMKIVPYAFKNFEERRIIGIDEVHVDEWGMIPLLKENVLGNFNTTALNEDFQEETKILPKKVVSKKASSSNKPLSEEEENEVLSSSVIDTDYMDNEFENFE
jgi:hypothetical protein